MGPLLVIDPDGRSPAERLTTARVTGYPGSCYLQIAPSGGALKVRVMAVPVATTPTFSANWVEELKRLAPTR